MISREFNLYLHAGHSIPLVINVNQYDRGEQWLFKLFNSDGTQYVPSSGAIVGIKSDNLGIINSGTVDSQGRVVINETQQMTAAVGKAVFELLIDDQTHGTANFIVLVEPKPGDNADLSESDLSLIQQAIDGTSATAIAQGVSDWMDDNLTPTTPVVDASLTVQGAAADSAKVGQELSDLKSQIAQSTGMSNDFKVALENLLTNVGFRGDDPTGRTYLEALHTAMYPPANLTRIEAVYTQSGDVYDSDSLDSLRDDLVVTAYYDNATSEVISSYTLSGTLAEGTSTITVSYGGKEVTFNVTVIHAIDIYHDFINDGSTWFLDQRSGTIVADGETKLVGTVTQYNAWNCVAKRTGLKKKLSDVSGKTGLLKWKATFENMTSGGLAICVALVSSAGTNAVGRQKYHTIPSHNSNGTYSEEFAFDLSTFTEGSGGSTGSYLCLWIYFTGNVGAVMTMEDIEFYAVNE